MSRIIAYLHVADHLWEIESANCLHRFTEAVALTIVALGLLAKAGKEGLAEIFVLEWSLMGEGERP